MTKARDLANAGTALTSVSATELGYVDGVTSAIQTQLNNKQAVVSGVDDTEIGYLNGVTSAIQTQLDGKIANSLIDAKGDLITATAADTPARLAVGTNGQFLSANSSTSTGLEWVAAPSSTTTLSQVASGSLSGSSVVISGLTQDNLQLIIGNYTANANSILRVRVNSNSTTNYFYLVNYINQVSTFDLSTYLTSSPNNGILLSDGYDMNQTNTNNGFVINFTNCKAAGFTNFWFSSRFNNSSNQGSLTTGQGYFGVAAQVTSLEIYITAGSFTGGTYKVIGG